MDIGPSEHFQEVAGYMEWDPGKRGWYTIYSIPVKVIKAGKGRKGKFWDFFRGWSAFFHAPSSAEPSPGHVGCLYLLLLSELSIRIPS